MARTRLPAPTAALERLSQAVDAVVGPAVNTQFSVRSSTASPRLTTPELQPVALDGKTLCGTLQAPGRAIHLLSILDQATGCTLSRTRVDEQTNEAKTALELLRGLVLPGRFVTGDAMFCQREVCQ